VKADTANAMKNKLKLLGGIGVAAAILCCAYGLSARAPRFQNAQSQPPGAMPGMGMSQSSSTEAAKGADTAMSGHDMEMGAHMFMTELLPASPADEKRAAEIVAELRPAIEKYKDYKVALADGFEIFLPDIPQPLYHFTNFDYAREAQGTFNPAHPTSLLYAKTADGYVLQGAMFTAPKRYTDAELNARVPLSVARWHKHVNLCFAPRGTPIQQVDRKQFGFHGAIATEAACEQAGGRWTPQIFNWMVHVYPYETDSAKIWAH
jgi:hypothetical protein